MLQQQLFQTQSDLIQIRKKNFAWPIRVIKNKIRCRKITTKCVLGQNTNAIQYKIVMFCRTEELVDKHVFTELINKRCLAPSHTVET